MLYQLSLNDQVLKEGDLKSLTALFSDLSGLNFAKNHRANWLNKMSSSESYQTYLQIMATEFGLPGWGGTLYLAKKNGEPELVHLFDTHKNMLESLPSTACRQRNG